MRILAGGAFYGNHNLAVVHLPEGVKWIGPAAFDACCRLRRVYWHSSVDRLEEAVFADCPELVSVENVQGVPVAWKSLGARAFFNCRSLKEICLQQVESIGSTALYGCTGLQWDRDYAMPSEILHQMGERALEETALLRQSGREPVMLGNILISGAGCSGEIVLPEGITGIAPFAFSENRHITRVSLPKACPGWERALSGPAAG